METNPLSIVYVDTSLLNPSEYNPRTHTKVQADQLKDSIARFGLVDPLICNNAKGRENVVIGGHFRLEIAKSIGLTEVPVVYVTISDLEKEKELNLRLNKNTGEFDFDKLKSFDLDLLLDIGFDHKSLDDLWNKELKQGTFDFKEEVEQIKKATTKLGDVILLGKHRLICGDSTKPETIARLCGDERADMIMSDPIYNISIDYNKGIGGKQAYGGNVNDSKSDEEYVAFLRASMFAALPFTKPDTHIFYWCDQVYIWAIQTLYHEFGIKNRRVCLWVKNGHNPTPGVAFNKCYEPCVYGTKGKPKLTKAHTKLNEVMNLDSGTGNDLLTSLDLWLVKRLPGSEYEHSTMKPPELYEKAIRRCTKTGDIILDSFSGSGSTLIAAEGLKRRVFAVELEPKFCDVTIKRFEDLTGTKAIIIPAHEEIPQDEDAPRAAT
jgi:DNA modification methylase